MVAISGAHMIVYSANADVKWQELRKRKGPTRRKSQAKRRVAAKATKPARRGRARAKR
jgi:hypothetical protein